MPIDTPLKSGHETLGAKFGETFGCALPRDYGDAAREYKFARESAGLVDTNYHAVISFTGADRARYLNAMLTNNIRDLAPGRGNISLLLSPQGRILAEAETLALEDLTDRTGTLALHGPKTPGIVRELSGFDIDS